MDPEQEPPPKDEPDLSEAQELLDSFTLEVEAKALTDTAWERRNQDD